MKRLLDYPEAGSMLKTLDFYDRYTISRMRKLFKLPKALPVVLEPYKIKPTGRPKKLNTRETRRVDGVKPRGLIRAELTLTQPTLLSVVAQQKQTAAETAEAEAAHKHRLWQAKRQRERLLNAENVSSTPIVT